MDPKGYHIFLDDGGVMNDNRRRAPQWETQVGDYFSERFGGDPSMWGSANRKYVEEVLSTFFDWDGFWGTVDYPTYIRRFIDDWVEAMFVNAGRELPPREEYDDIYYSNNRYVTPRVLAAFPGVNEAIKTLFVKGFTLHTASGEDSVDLNGYLTGMGVREFFTNLYGPDLISTMKNSERFYLEIFEDLDISPEQAIIIDDNPRVLEMITGVGANAIQACQSMNFQPCIPDYVMSMSELPDLVDKIISRFNE